jgi:mRNA interferase MazF
MKISRGDVVLLDFPFSGGGASKVRPALVVQNDTDNQRLATAIVVMITSQPKPGSNPRSC